MTYASHLTSYDTSMQIYTAQTRFCWKCHAFIALSYLNMEVKYINIIEIDNKHPRWYDLMVFFPQTSALSQPTCAYE